MTQDGSVVSQDGQRFSQLPQWVNSCWATLGHNKRVDRKTAYTKVSTVQAPHCQEFIILCGFLLLLTGVVVELCQNNLLCMYSIRIVCILLELCVLIKWFELQCVF